MASDPLSLDFGRDKRFCVYIYRDPRPSKRQQAIYVGKGRTNSRPDQHWRRGNPHNPLFSRVLSKIRSSDLQPIVEYVGFFDDEADAYALEIALIKRFGRRNTGAGPLCNLTAGGDGVAMTPEQHSVRTRKSAAAQMIKKIGIFGLTQNQRRAYGYMSNAKLTSDQRSERARKREAKIGPEERSAIARRREAAMAPEVKSARCRKSLAVARAAMTPEQRSARTRKANAALMAMTQEERSAIAIARALAKTPEQRSAGVRKANASRTPEERTASLHKAWDTRRRNAGLLDNTP